MLFVTQHELDGIRGAESSSQLGQFREALRQRVAKNTAEPTLVQSADTNLWWHLVWERMSDAAFIYCLDRSPALGQWIHDRVMEIVEAPIRTWVGPGFRNGNQVKGAPMMGALETGHTTNAVGLAYDLAGDVFSDTEKAAILEALREKALVLCRSFLANRLHYGNWDTVLCSGLAMAGVLLEDRQAIEEAVASYQQTLTYYDEDGYDESIQYGNYASHAMLATRRFLLRYDPSLAPRLSIVPIANTVKWAVSSLFYMKKLGGEHGEGVYPRTANFGDSGATFRPSGDVLATIAAESTDPTVAGLARYLLDMSYADPFLGPDELATFGFFNHFGFATLLSLPHCADSLTPEQAGMPLLNAYKTGTTTLRDRWADPETILAVQSGYEAHVCPGHRHLDQNSFILVHRNERYFADPGHCCYRTEAQQRSVQTSHHNTWDFIDRDGNTYTQRIVDDDMSLDKKPPLNDRVVYPQAEGFDIVASDCAKAYGEHFKRCERIFVCAFPHAMFIIDRIETDIPVRVQSHFVLNNRNNGLRVNQVDDYRLVFRRGDGGIKFFSYTARNGVVAQEGLHLPSRCRYGFMHENYHPQANQIGQGKEGSAWIYDYRTAEFSTEHTLIHAFAMQETEEIQKWHIRNRDGKLAICSAGDAERFVLEVRTDGEFGFTAHHEA